MNPEEFLLIDELKLVGFGESDSGGAWIKLQVDPDDLALFRGRKGAILEVAIRVVDNDGNRHGGRADAQEPKGGPWSRDAVGLCKQPGFTRFVAEVLGLSDPVEAIYRECRITSRKWLDHDPMALDLYHTLKATYLAWQREANRHEQDSG